MTGVLDRDRDGFDESEAPDPRSPGPLERALAGAVAPRLGSVWISGLTLVSWLAGRLVNSTAALSQRSR